MPDPIKTVEGYDSPFIGFRFFLGKPKLWLVPLVGTLCAWFLLFCIVLCVSYKAWPEPQSSELRTTLKIAEALGIGAMSGLAAWVILLPFFLNLSFEHLIKHVYLAKGDTLQSLSFVHNLMAGCVILLKTLHWRVFWVILGLLMMFICVPITLVVMQIGIAHSAMIDGCDLSLGVKGVDTKKRVELMRQHRWGMLAGGLVGGFVGCFLIPTVLVWLFWMPGLYVGAALWVREWV